MTRFAILTTLMAGWVSTACALKPATPFTDHMVLQRQMPVPVWGRGEPGRTVIVSVQGKSARAEVGKDGRWRCELPALKASEKPLVFTISDGATTIELKDVLVGEVWICCGQSNMEMGRGAVPEINALANEAEAEHRPVRSFWVPQAIAFEEQERCRGAWTSNPSGSAIAAGFEVLLQKAAGVPVGVVQTAWGSSSIEGWTPATLTNALPHFREQLERDVFACRDLVQKVIDQSKKTNGRIKRYSEDPEEEKRLNEKYRAANIFARTRPNLLYNAMLHPFIPMACRGMVYYQGESNGKTYDDMVRYRTSQRVWLDELRRRWGREDLYFLSVMLPGFGRTVKSGPHSEDLEAPDAHSWAIIRDSQLAILDDPPSGVANTIDLGEAKKIHPKDKLPVCERLVLIVRHDVLGEKDLTAFGPMFDKIRFTGRRVSIAFDHAKGLTTTDGEPPKAFWISEDGSTWVKPEEARIVEHRGVMLVAPAGTRPKYVRYAYAAKPRVNLVNGAGLPAYPFTTLPDE